MILTKKILMFVFFIQIFTSISYAADTYGSMSVCTETGGWGYAYKDKTAQEATKEAYSYCIKYGSSSCCTQNSYIKNECAAIVRGKKGNYVFGLGVEDTKKKAILDAFDECDKKADNCKFKKAFCTYDK